MAVRIANEMAQNGSSAFRSTKTRLFSLRLHARGGVNNSGAGRSSGFRIIRSTAPSPRASCDGTREWRQSGRSSPITAAGPRWTCTIFPLIRPTRGGPAPRTIQLSKFAVGIGLSPIRSRRGRSIRESRSRFQFDERDGDVKKVRDAPSPVGAPRQAFRRQPATTVDPGH